MHPTAPAATTAVEKARERRLPAPALRRALREEAGLTLDDIAQDVGCSRQAVAYWETGIRTPRGRYLLAYARVLRSLQGAL